ncbi:hypothetical protein O181_115348 [Austropuccinia psidii MF-1]|uniref:Uncharacterized protein n=1 Tax=Austropuccinia psidii MF-1 TaxID=1389203 RepID=A0A9Q3K6A5_9BASI|nr:hypothetical protein [Austropuccinia psidii MF-1]
MEGAAPSRRGGMKSRRSRSFSGPLGGSPGLSEGARARLGEAEDEEEAPGQISCQSPAIDFVRCDYETDDNITINQQYYVCSYEI